MRNRTVLSLMEQLMMLLVFALAAAICVATFAHAHTINSLAEDLDTAVILCRNAAEVIKATNGDEEKTAKVLDGSLDGDTIRVCYDNALNVNCQGRYALTIQLAGTRDLIGYADVAVSCEGSTVYSITVAWQEDSQ